MSKVVLASIVSGSCLFAWNWVLTPCVLCGAACYATARAARAALGARSNTQIPRSAHVLIRHSVQVRCACQRTTPCRQASNVMDMREQKSRKRVLAAAQVPVMLCSTCVAACQLMSFSSGLQATCWLADLHAACVSIARLRI